MLQAELKGSKPDFNIEMLGVNRSNQVPFNFLITDQRTLPWLQDQATGSAWEAWQVTYRDVRILDAGNRLVATYNLTQHDLSQPANYLELKALFLNAARAVDSDSDALPDDWETKQYGTLSMTRTGDLDADGFDNYTEFIFGTNPLDALDRPQLQPFFVSGSPGPQRAVSFRRQAGGLVNYVVEGSSDLVTWGAEATRVGPLQPVRNSFDGSGTVESFHVLKGAAATGPGGFLRVRAVPKAAP